MEFIGARDDYRIQIRISQEFLHAVKSRPLSRSSKRLGCLPGFVNITAQHTPKLCPVGALNGWYQTVCADLSYPNDSKTDHSDL